MATVTLSHVSKRFGNVPAVNDLNLEVYEGECFSLLGPSGCGKTTTLRMIAGFEDLDEGEIQVGDRVFSSSKRRYYLPPDKRDFGMVFQAFAVWPHMDIFDNVAFPLRIKGMNRADIETKTRRALEYTGLLKVRHSYPSELSGGEKQRIALARAIAINPKVMLLDEPLSNLDPKLREEMRFEIKDLQRRLGFTILYVTHDQAEAMALSDRILVMKEGVVQQVGPPIEVYDRPANRFVFSFIGLSNFLPVEVADDRVHIAGSLEAGSLCPWTSSGIRERRWTLACRPSDIDFMTSDGAEGLVTRVAFLGDLVDYRVSVGGVEVRVQKSVNQPQRQVGEHVRLRVNRFRGYTSEPET